MEEKQQELANDLKDLKDVPVAAEAPAMPEVINNNNRPIDQNV